jgi:predicted DsbA family dithiol-disulfide isomerase
VAVRRRDVLIAAAAIAAVMAAPRINRLFDTRLEFKPITGLPGFRKVVVGSTSSLGAGAILSGIETPSELQAQLRKDFEAAPCTGLFGSPKWPAGVVPVAVFTDYYCPYCPTFSDMILRLADEGLPIQVTWHDLPVLGPQSVTAAKAAVAADAQDQYLPVHRRLMRTVLRPGPSNLVRLAEEFEMDATEFVRQVNSAQTETKLEQARAMAAVLGIIGTPAAVIGRSLVIGEMDEKTIRTLVQMEGETPFDGCEGR